MTDEARVRIVGDASGVAPAVQFTKDQLAGLDGTLSALTASFNTLAAEMRASMSSGSASTAEMTTEMGLLEAETEREAVSLREMALSAREGVEAVVEMKEAMFGFGELLMAAFAVEEVKKAAEKMAEVAERTEHLSKILGVSTQQVQALRGAAVATGIDFETLVRGMTLMDRKFELAPESFRKMGVEVKNGATQMELLEAVMNRFKNLDSGPQKAALAFQTMGRAGAQMIPFLNMGADGLAELTRKSEEYGVINEDATKKGMALAESVNESKLAWDGLGNTMTSAFAPMLKDVVDGFNTLSANITKSYNEGGTWKVVFDGIEGVLTTIKKMLGDVGDAFSGIFSTSGQKASDWSTALKTYFNQVAENGTYLKVQFVNAIETMVMNYHIFVAETLVWWSRVKVTYEEFLNWIDKIEAEVNLLGVIVQEALSLQWGKIAQTWDNGMAMIQKVVAARSAAIIREAQNLRIQAAKEMAAAGGVSADFTKWAMQQIIPPAGGGGGIKTAEGDGGGGGPPVNFGKDKKPKEAKSRMSEWEEGLAEKKLALQEEDEADNSFREMSKQEEANYWKAILDNTKLSHEELIAVKQKYFEASFAARKEDFDDHIATLKRELDAAKGNVPEMQRIGDEIVAAYRKAYGQRSKEAQDAERQIGDIMRRGADEQIRIEEELFKKIEEIQQLRADDALHQSEYLNQIGATSNAQLLEEERRHENAMYASKLQELRNDIDIFNRDPLKNKDKIKATNLEIEKLEQQHTNAMNDIDRKGELQRTQIVRQAIGQTSQLWSQNIAKMLTLQQSFSTSVKNLYLGMVGVLSDAIAGFLEKWITQELTNFAIKIGLIKSDTAQTIAAQSAKAGASGTASMAAAPFPLNLTAPGFGASMASLAASYGSLAAFDVGAYNLSSDGIGMLHKGETIIPADQAGGWRNVMGLFASMPRFSVPSVGFGSHANSNAPAAANAGGVTLNYHDHTGTSSPGQRRAKLDEFAKWAKAAHRAGKFGFKLPD